MQKLNIKMKNQKSLSAYSSRLTTEKNKKDYTYSLCRVKNKNLQVLHVKKLYVGVGLAESGRRIADSVTNRFNFLIFRLLSKLNQLNVNVINYGYNLF
jgi:hypothetical protein